MIEVFKMLNIYDKEISPKLSFNETSTRGHAYTLTNRAIKDLRKYSFTQRITSIWNNLPSNVVESTNLNNFKTNLDKHLYHNEFKYDYQTPLP